MGWACLGETFILGLSQPFLLSCCMKHFVVRLSPLLLLGSVLFCLQALGLLSSVVFLPTVSSPSEFSPEPEIAGQSGSGATQSSGEIPASGGAPASATHSDATSNNSSGFLSFDLDIRDSISRLNPMRLLRRQPEIRSFSDYDLEALFVGGSDSLVAKAVGGAEGTRTADGGYTSFYRGHTDPGNGVWNLGTFSYQHGASSPQEADRKQLRRLRQQVSAIQHRAEKAGISLNLIEVLNGIDLANQSPLAALGEPGYAEWMAEAYRQGRHGEDAILWARVMGYWDVRRDRWNAPGLGNTEPLIRRDQARRMDAIAKAVTAHGTLVEFMDPPASETYSNEMLQTPVSESEDQPSASRRSSEDGTLSF